MTFTLINRATLSRIEQYVTTTHRNLRIPGLAMAIVQNGTIIYQCGLGEAAPSHAVTPQTPFILGSLSKSFTALAIMQLVEAGKLNLDERVQHYIPWFHFHGLPSTRFQLRDDAASSLITVRHLLNHTSGVSRYTGRILLSGRGGKTIEQSVRELSKVKLVRRAGSHFEYSNINYLVAGLLIEIASGMSYEDYIHEQDVRAGDRRHPSRHARPRRAPARWRCETAKAAFPSLHGYVAARAVHGDGGGRLLHRDHGRRQAGGLRCELLPRATRTLHRAGHDSRRSRSSRQDPDGVRPHQRCVAI